MAGTLPHGARPVVNFSRCKKADHHEPQILKLHAPYGSHFSSLRDNAADYGLERRIGGKHGFAGRLPCRRRLQPLPRALADGALQTCPGFQSSTTGLSYRLIFLTGFLRVCYTLRNPAGRLNRRSKDSGAWVSPAPQFPSHFDSERMPRLTRRRRHTVHRQR